MRARLILNPSSGRERASASLELLTGKLREKYRDVDVSVTAGDGDAARAAVLAVSDGCDALFVAGGDGTLNEAINGLATANLLERIPVGVVPFGTGNDFAAALGISPEIEPALDLLLGGDERRTDLGEVNGRTFVNTSGGGFIAQVSVAVTPQLKTLTGRLAYLVGGAQALMEFDPVAAAVSAEPGGFTFDRPLYAFAVCNSPLIGGGKLIAPEAAIDDGLLDLCLIESMSALEFVALARKVADGDHVSDPRVVYVKAHTIRIELEREIKVNTDGEVFEARSCDYRVRPKAARFLGAHG